MCLRLNSPVHRSCSRLYSSVIKWPFFFSQKFLHLSFYGTLIVIWSSLQNLIKWKNQVSKETCIRLLNFFNPSLLCIFLVNCLKRVEAERGQQSKWKESERESFIALSCVSHLDVCERGPNKKKFSGNFANINLFNRVVYRRATNEKSRARGN